MSVMPTPRTPTAALDVDRIRTDFPILSREMSGRPLVYLDNAATAQKPQAVLDAVAGYYRGHNANVHRGVHTLSMEATDAYEAARRKIQSHLGAERVESIVFLRGTTEAVNFVAQTYGRSRITAGDEIVISAMEHHSNIVPWQLLCEQVGAVLKVAPIDDNGDIIVEQYEKLLGERTRLVALAHISNALGTINPLDTLVPLARRRGIPVLIDGAQAAPHTAIDVRALDCDFYTISGHKVFAPTGIGALYIRPEWLDKLPPYQGGGEMIRSVTFEKTEYAPAPARFEAGTPNIAGAIGLGAALDYINALGLDAIERYEHDLLDYGTAQLATLPQVRMIGTARRKASVLSFELQGVHPHDVGTILDQQGIAIRTGHHCAQPVMDRFGVPATCRASLAFYNTRAEIDALVAGLRKVLELFA